MSFKCTKAWYTGKNLVYRTPQKISDILWDMLENVCKCIFNCVSWFVSILLYFNVFCDVNLI